MKSCPIPFPDLNTIEEKVLPSFFNNRNIIAERKIDGVASINIKSNNKTELWGRGTLIDGSQSNYTLQFPEIVKAINEMDNCILCGEIAIFNGEKYENFRLIQRRMRRLKDITEYSKQFPATLVVHDILKINDTSLISEPLKERHHVLKSMEKNNELPDGVKLLNQKQTASGKQRLWDKVVKYKLEGVVFKYKDGVFPNGMYKHKRHETQDVFINGYTEGTGRLKAADLFGSLKMYQYVNGTVEYVGNVGSGISDIQRHQLNKKIKNNEQVVLEVLIDEITPDGKFRHARLFRERFDKSKTQCIRK